MLGPRPYYVLALALVGCSGGGAPSGTAPTDAPSTGLSALAGGASADLGLRAGHAPEKPLNDNQKSVLAQQAATDLEAFFASRDRASLSPPSAALTDVARPTVAEANAEVLAAAAKAWDDPTPPSPTTTAPDTRPASFADGDPATGLAKRMASLLTEPESRRIPDAVALAAVESLSPGALADLESPASSLHAALSASERATLIAARDRVLANPSAANDTLVKSLSKMAPATPLRITRGLLCTRVQGFGRYDPFETDRFLAGRAIRVIVYTELENFASRPATQADPVQQGVPLSDQYTVDLTQSLSLYHDPSGLLAWHRPAQKVIETTRGKRRDFYLIHTVDLPASLTIGTYVLKATVIDKTTGASDEVNIPIKVVAK